MSGPILVINPNSNADVTAGLDETLGAFRLPGGPEIRCETLEEGPFGIQSQRDTEIVVAPLIARLAARPEAAAIVIACYSDPGLFACREASAVPVYGIQESGVATALARADRFGVIAVAEPSIPRHRRAMARMGVLDRLAGERALNMTVAETASGADTFDRLQTVGDALIGDGAEAIVLGCAGMARHRAGLERALGRPVIDPVQAAVAMALGTLLAGAETA